MSELVSESVLVWALVSASASALVLVLVLASVLVSAELPGKA